MIELTGDQSKNSLNNELESRVHPKFGRCVVYSPMKSSITKGVVKVKIYQNFSQAVPLRIFIHADDQFWDATNHFMGYKLSPSDIATAQVLF